MLPAVFLSYRRSDTGGEAGRLADALHHQLGRSFVFRDVENITPGDQFDEVLNSQLTGSKVVLVLIGSGWLEEINNRLDGQDVDYHRVEVASALRDGKRIIPVLLNGATLPPIGTLPEDLLALGYCQAISIRDEAWKTDIDRLIEAIGRPYRWNRLALRSAIALVVTTLVVWKLTPLLIPSWGSDYVALRRLMLTLLSGYGLVELIIGIRHFKRLQRLRQSTHGDRMPPRVKN